MRLFQRENGTWYVEFGRGKKRSLKTTDQKVAEKRFAQVKEAYLKGKLKNLFEGKEEKASTITLGQFREEYVEWAYDALESKATARANRLALDKLIEQVGKDKRLSDITLRDVDQLVASLKRKGRKATSINVYLRHLRALFRGKAMEWEFLKASPLASIKEIPCEKRRLPNFLGPEEVPAFLARIECVDRRRIVTAYLTSGRRRAELLGLEWPDCELDRDRYLVRHGNSKSHLDRWYPMHPLFKAVLLSIGPRQAGRIFERWSHPDTISHIVKEELVAAGYGYMRLHDLRHSFASLTLEEGANSKELQELLGHSDPRATDIYTHVRDARLKDVLSSVKFGLVDLGGGGGQNKKG